MLRIGIDVGGTFTDVVSVDPQGRVTIAKVHSTPEDQSLGVMEGLDRLAEGLGLDRATMLARTERIVHGTTVATNALLEHKGAKVGLLTTEGHRDIIEMREGLKDDRYDLRQPPPRQLVPRDRRLGVRERIRPDGRVEIALDRESLAAAIATLKEPGRRGRGDLLPAQLARREPRACDGRGRASRHAGRLCRPLVRSAAPDQGIRSLLHHRGQRIRRPRARALPHPARRAVAGSGACLTGADHPIARGRGDDCRSRAARSRRRAFGPRRWRCRQSICRQATGPWRPHPLRHGRHLDGHLPRGGRRGSNRLGPAHRRPTRSAAEPGHRQHRRRRRLDRPRRSQWPAPCGTRKRRRTTGACLLWPRR